MTTHYYGFWNVKNDWSIKHCFKIIFISVESYKMNKLVKQTKTHIIVFLLFTFDLFFFLCLCSWSCTFYRSCHGNSKLGWILKSNKFFLMFSSIIYLFNFITLRYSLKVVASLNSISVSAATATKFLKPLINMWGADTIVG